MSLMASKSTLMAGGTLLLVSKSFELEFRGRFRWLDCGCCVPSSGLAFALRSGFGCFAESWHRLAVFVQGRRLWRLSG